MSSKTVLEGAASLTASIVLTSMMIWMARTTKKIKKDLYRKMDVAIKTGRIIGIAALAFIVVFREGF